VIEFLDPPHAIGAHDARAQPVVERDQVEVVATRGWSVWLLRSPRM
jgi:hypothetical protein